MSYYNNKQIIRLVYTGVFCLSISPAFAAPPFEIGDDIDSLLKQEFESPTAPKAESLAPQTLTQTVERINDGMKEAARILQQRASANTDSVERAVEQQTEVLTLLDSLFAQADAAQSSQSSPANQAAQTESQTSSDSQQEQSTSANNPTAAQTGVASELETTENTSAKSSEQNSEAADAASGNKSQPNKSQPMKSQSESKQGGADGQPENFESGDGSNAQNATNAEKNILAKLRSDLQSSGQSNWGTLPPQLRKQIDSVYKFEFAPGYQQQTRDYFERMNQAASRRFAK